MEKILVAVDYISREDINSDSSNVIATLHM